MLIYKCLQFTTLKYKQDISQKFIYMQALLYPPHCLRIDIYNLWWSRNPHCCVCDHLLPYDLFLFNGNAYRLPLIPSGPVLSRCSSFDIYGSYMYIGYIGRKQGFEYVYAMKKSCHQHLLRPLSNNLIDFCNFIYRQTFSFR